jgi:hypothetical protein
VLEIYCDASSNYGDSFIGCVVFRNEEQILQITKKIVPNNRDNQICEKKAISFAKTLFDLLSINEEKSIIYNDSTSAVRDSQIIKTDRIEIKSIHRDYEFQWIADKLSKKFPVRLNRERIELNQGKMEVYCNSNYNGNLFIGNLIFQNGEMICQCTMKKNTKSEDYIKYNIAAIEYSMSFSKQIEDKNCIIIYNECEEAIHYFNNLHYDDKFCFQITSNETYKRLAQNISKNFPVDYPGEPELHKQKIKSVNYNNSEMFNDIINNHRCVLYIQNNKVSNKYSIYHFIIRSSDEILYKESIPLKKGSIYKNFIKYISRQLVDPKFQNILKTKGVELENSYFLLTSATKTLLITDKRANSILPSNISHQIIYDSNQYADDFFRKLEEIKNE